MIARILAAVAFLAFWPGAQAASASREIRPMAAAPMEFRFDPAVVFPVVAAPGRVTDIALEPGERLVESNAIAAGDTARWVIGDTVSGEGASRRVHVLVKPTASTLSTNLVINTQRRTYFLELRASNTGFLTQIRWRYPDAVVFIAAPPASPPPPSRAASVQRLNFDYVVRGAKRLRPTEVFDDGERTVIVFSRGAAIEHLPPLLLVGPDGRGELLNYRVEGRRLVIDRLIDHAELRFGLKASATRVRIERSALEAAR